MCYIPVCYGCGHTRLTNSKPCLAQLQGTQCHERALLGVPPINVANACLVCTAQVQANAANVQALRAEDQARAIQHQLNAARKKATKAHNEAGTAQLRVERAKYMGQAAIQIEVRQDDRHLAELEERMSGPLPATHNEPEVSSTRPRQPEFADVLRALENAEKRKLDQEFAEFCVRFRRENAQKEHRQQQAEPSETATKMQSEIKTEEDPDHDRHLDHLPERMRQTIDALDSNARLTADRPELQKRTTNDVKEEKMSPPPSPDQHPGASQEPMSPNLEEESMTPTTDDYIEFTPQLQILRDVKLEHSRGRPYGVG